MKEKALVNSFNASRTPEPSLVNRSFGAVITALCVCFLWLTFSQEVIAKEDEETSEKIIEEVMVTAQKREQSLQEVAMSITAYGERTLELAGIDNSEEYLRMTPGIAFTVYGPAGEQFGDRGVFVRGVSSTNVLSGGQPTGFYIDETPVPFSDPNLFDINRIEILRGPQGTLYGSGSMGGTIKIVTNRPDASEFYGKADATTSTTKGGGQNYEARGMVNIPVVSDRIAIRASGSWRHDEGYIDNIVAQLPCDEPGPACTEGLTDLEVQSNRNDVDRTTARIAAEIKVTDNLTITPSIFGEKMDLAYRAHYTIGLEDESGNLRTNTIGPADAEENNFTLYDLRAEYEFTNAKLTSSTSWFEWKKDNILDISWFSQEVFGAPPGTPVALQTIVDRDLFTQELRLASEGDQGLNWLVGMFYQHEKFTWDNYSQEDSVASETKLLTDTHNVTNTKQYAVFGEATYQLADTLSATGGLRYFDTDVTFERDVIASLFFGPETFSERLGPSEESGFTPKVQLTYEPNEDRLFYGLISKGFRAGGPTLEPGNIPACLDELAALGLAPTNEFDSDDLWNYEVGAKTILADGQVTANAAAYYIDWSNIQQQIQLQCGFAFTSNFGSAKSQGMELEIAAIPIDRLELGFSVGYVDAVLAENNPSGIGKKGDRLLNIPEWTIGINGTYTVPINSGWSLYVRGDYQYVGDVATSFNVVGMPDDNLSYPSYDVAGFSVGLTNDSWDLVAFIENAFDERPEFISFGDSFGAQFTQAVTIRPRTIGLTARRRF